MYSLEIQIFRGYWMVNWFKQEFGLQNEMRLAEETGVETETAFRRAGTVSPARLAGPGLQPYWSPGIRHPGPEARGAIIGFGDVHTRAHIYRAILEGVAYALREGRRTHQQAQRRAHPRAARGRRRQPEQRRHADHRRYLRPAGISPACI